MKARSWTGHCMDMSGQLHSQASVSAWKNPGTYLDKKVAGAHTSSGRFEEETMLLPHSLITTLTTSSELLYINGAQFEA